MIQIVQDRGIARVACFCDVCDEEITNADGAMYRWNTRGAEFPVGSRDAPSFYHKGRCAESVARNKNAEGRGEIHPWMELRVFVIYLAANLDVDLERAKESAKRLALI